MLREQLEYHWRSHVLPGAAMVFLSWLVFYALAMLHYGELSLDTSVERSTPASDVVVYAEGLPAREIADSIAGLDEVDAVHVDAQATASALSDVEHATLNVRQLPSPALRTQVLVDGHYPSDATEIALASPLARALHVGVNDDITLTGKGVAERVTVVGIYARSPLVDQRDSGFEALHVTPDPSYIAVHREGQTAGGIEVRGTNTTTSAQLTAAILQIPGTVVVSGQERDACVYEQQSQTLSSMTAAVPWLLLTGFITATGVLLMSMTRIGHLRVHEIRKLRSLGVTQRHVAKLIFTELLAVASLAGFVGLAGGLASVQGTITLLRTAPGAAFLPDSVGLTGAPFAWTILALIGAVAISGLSAILGYRRSEIRAPHTRLAVLTGVTLIGVILINLALTISTGSRALTPFAGLALVLLETLAIVTMIALVARFSRRFTARLRTAFVPYTRIGLIRVLALLVILLSSACLSSFHTVHAFSGGNDEDLRDRFDLSISATSAVPVLSPEQIAVIAHWPSTNTMLPITHVPTDVVATGDFQIGALYAVDPVQADTYFSQSLHLTQAIVVPRGTRDLPAAGTLNYVDSAGIRHVVSRTIREADVPVALVSQRDLGQLLTEEVWVRLTPAAFTHISTAYTELEERLSRASDQAAPALFLAVNQQNEPADPAYICVIWQASLLAILAFIALARLPRTYAEFALETRYLRSRGVPTRTIRIERIVSMWLSTVLTLVAGAGLGLLLAYIVMRTSPSGGAFDIPIMAISRNLGAVALAAMGLSVIGYQLDVANDTSGVK